MTGTLSTWYAGSPVITYSDTNNLTTWFAGSPFTYYEFVSAPSGAKGLYINASGNLEETTTLTKVLKLGANGFEEVNASGGGVKILQLGTTGIGEVVS